MTRDGRIVLASRNAGKARELSGLLAPYEVVALPDEIELPPETGATFADNALIKARTANALTGLPALGDDSGLEAAALHGEPGVRSARFAGEDATDAENVALLLARAPAGSTLAFVCALAYVDGDRELVVHGRCSGRLAAAPRGAGGFGYDPVFIAGDDPAGRTMAELSAAEKAAISHRGRAARALAERLG